MQKLQLSIPEPCHENWQQMTPTEQGRFCNACAKEVIDFSTMTDMQVLNYFTNLKHEKVCGRALPEQLDRTISRPEPPKKRLFWYWNYVVMFFMLITKGNAARAQGTVKVTTQQQLNSIRSANVNNALAGKAGEVAISRIVTGKVTDEIGNAVPFASIRIKGTPTGVITDANGVYSLRIKPDAVLEIYNLGFKSVEIITGSQSVFNTVLEKANILLQGGIVIAQRRDPDEYYGPLDKSKRVAVIQVKDEATGKAIPNAGIIIKPRYKNADTVLADKKGMYKIKRIKDGDEYAVKISAEGYEPNEFTIEEYDFKNRKKEWEVLLRKKKELVSGASLRSTAIPVTGKETVVRIGGVRLIDEARGPLYVVDGTILSNSKLDSINPDDIEDISVLQGPAAAALFGSDGANGAIVITTKHPRVEILDTVTVTAYPVIGKLTKTTTTCYTSVMGGMVPGVTVRVQNPITDSLKAITNAITGAIKVYPNPVQRNSDFSVQLKLKQPGNNYSILISDATGKILLQQKFNAAAKEHTEKVTADNRWAAGIYYIRVFDAQNKLISKSSFVFQ